MKKIVLKIKLLNIENDGYHLSIKAKINGKVANLLIDTGASRTVFDLNRMDKFINKKDLKKNDQLSTGLGTSSMVSHVSEIKKLDLGGLIIANYDGIFIDLSHVNHSYENIKLKPIDGVIGSDILLQFKAVVNYEKMELVLKFKP
ncbi:MAG: clan AA aspartic protease [Bacteroidetes bacterium]|nr:clan AA aspartic protease [Bacteroidota bacterium]